MKPPQKQPLTQRTGKDTGVKRQILVAVSEDLPETHSNIEQIWSLINANGLKLVLACDMKVANIIFSLQTYSSMQPCTWCDVKSKCLAKSGNLPTLGSIKSSLKSFQQSDRVVANAKLFGNVIRKPIVSGPDSVLIFIIMLFKIDLNSNFNIITSFHCILLPIKFQSFLLSIKLHCILLSIKFHCILLSIKFVSLQSTFLNNIEVQMKH